MRNLLILLSFLFTGTNTFAQETAAGFPLSIEAGYHLLHTTHGNNFNGFSMSVNKLITRNAGLGAGIEYSASPYHEDNGFFLKKLRFVPVFADEKFYNNPLRPLAGYLHFSEGLSFAGYVKNNIAGNNNAEQVRETGIYLYGGAGIQCSILNRFSINAETGIKGFHISFNSLDVNPHGITARAGFKIFLPARGKSFKNRHTAINENTGAGNII